MKQILLWFGGLVVLNCLAPLPASAQVLTVTDGLQLWLKADAGVTADVDGNVSEWKDQTSNVNHAAQLTLANSPKLVSNVVNGKPVLRFDGNDDYMVIPDSESLSITGDLTTFFVIRIDDFANYRAVWAKTVNNQPAPVDWYTVINTGVPRVFRGNGQGGVGNAALVDSTQALQAGVFTMAGFDVSAALVTHYVGSQAVGSGSIFPAIADGDTPVIIGSRADFVTRMRGDIAEIVIYNRALTSVERTSIRDYFGTRYNIINQLPTATLAVTPPGPALPAGQTVTLTATASDLDGAVSRVQFFCNGAPLASASVPPYSVDVILETGGSYQFTAKAIDDRNGSGDSAMVGRTVAAQAEAPLDVLTNLSLWVKADAGTTTGAGDTVLSWSDQSGQTNHAVAADEFTAPVLVAGGLNGKPVLRFDGQDDTLSVADSPSVSFDGDITSFYVVKMDDFVTYRTVWAKTATNLPASVDQYLLPDSGIPRFFRGGGPGTTLFSMEGPIPFRAGSFEVAGFGSAGNVQSQYINGLTNGSVTGNAQIVDLDIPLLIGRRDDGVTRLKGDLAEIVIYKGSLSAEDRLKVQRYLGRKYTLPVTTVLNTAPIVTLTAPAEGASFAAPANVNLTATAADTGGSIARVEFLVNGSIANTDTVAPYQTTVPFGLAGALVLQVRAVDNLGAVTLSTPVSATITSATPADLPNIPALAFWLKSDAGVVSAGGAVSQWSDQSNNVNHARQSVVSKRPQLIPAVLNGKPVLRFDGADDDLAALSSPTLANVGDISSFFVARFDDFVTYRAVWSKTDGNVPRATDWYTEPGTGLPRVFRGGPAANQVVVALSAPTAGQFDVLGFNTTGPLLHHFLNGKLTGEGNITTPLQDTGKSLLIGTRDDAVTRMKGDIAEIIIYNGSLSDAERAQVITYLGAKYGIAVSNVSTALPPLTITTAAGNVTVSWPAESTGFTLESSPDMSPASWFEVLGVVGNSVTEPYNQRTFYHLRRTSFPP